MTPSTSVRLALADSRPAATAADALLVAVGPARGRTLEVVSEGLTAVQATRVVDAARAIGATGKSGEVTRIPAPTGFTADSVVVVGLGDAAARADLESVRSAFGSAIRSVAGTRKVAIAALAGGEAATAAAVLGARLGAYRFDDYRSKSKRRESVPPGRIVVLTSGQVTREARAALDELEIVASAVALVRDLVNTPPNALPPAAFAAAADDAAAGLPIDVTIWDEDALAADGCGGILAVGQGSANPPRLVRLSYGDGHRPHLSLVGKGITFDTGGISIKPASNMDHMKSDMAGAAAVLASITAIAALGLPIRVTAWLAIAENMPSGTAQRPGDVFTTADGTTVEVLNTDAEGRLVLADALAFAVREKPDLIVDIATLTGAQRIALGARVAGVMGNTDAAREDVCAAADAAGEAAWPMPLPGYLRGTLDSATADIANLGDGLAGMLVGGIFLNDFVPATQQWAHIDIAGPSFNDKAPYSYVPKGGTGFGVRTFVELASRMSGRGAGPTAG